MFPVQEQRCLLTALVAEWWNLDEMGRLLAPGALSFSPCHTMETPGSSESTWAAGAAFLPPPLCHKSCKNYIVHKSHCYEVMEVWYKIGGGSTEEGSK